MLTFVVGGLVLFAVFSVLAPVPGELGSLPDDSARWRRLRLQVEGKVR